MSARKKSVRARSAKPTNALGKEETSLPDLDAIYSAFVDAYAIVRAACITLRESDTDENEQAGMFALRQGVDALAKVDEELEKADTQLSYFQRIGGAS